MEAVELVPFAAYARAELASVMTAHVRFPALDEDVAATLSRGSMTGLLRERLGFEGVVVSDDLEMKAIADPAAAAVEAVRAGVDVLLVCHHPAVQHRVLDALVDATRKGHISDERLREAHARIDALVHRFVRPAEDWVTELGSVEHRRLVEELALAIAALQVAGRDPPPGTTPPGTAAPLGGRHRWRGASASERGAALRPPPVPRPRPCPGPAWLSRSGSVAASLRPAAECAAHERPRRLGEAP